MKKHYYLDLFLIFSVFWILPCYAEEADNKESKESDKKETIVSNEIVVKGKQGTLVETMKDKAYTGNTVTKEGIERLGGAAQTSIQKTIELMPSVNVEAIESYGFNGNGPSGSGALRIRGMSDYGASTIDGVPLNTGTRFGNKENFFDMENFSDITVYRGATPVDRSFGFGTSCGEIAATTLGPFEKPGLMFSESAGRFDFTRIFLRADTGQLTPALKTFSSYSYTAADKWKGLGHADRHHGSFGLDLSPTSKMVSAQLYSDYSSGTTYNYRGLSYAQTKDLDKNYKYDYNTSLTGISATDANYYKFNKIDNENVFVHSNIQIQPADNHTFTLKPYFGYDDILNVNTQSSFNAASGAQDGLTGAAVYHWHSERKRYGNIIDYKTKLFDTDLTAGYWIEMFKWPRYAQKMYRVTSTGDLSFAGWSKQLITYDGNFIYQSPYVTANKTISNFNIYAGLKYFRYTQPKTTAYLNTSIGNISEDDISKYGTKDVNAGVGEKTTDVWLPSAALSYKINEHATPYFNYGRGYNIAYFGPGGIINGYWSNKATLDAAGITADDLADKQKIPTVENFDLGVRLKLGSWRLTPIVFYSYYKNKNVNIYDSSTGLKYRQTAGKGESYGSELEVSGNIIKSLSVFASGTYNKNRFRSNVPTSGTDTVDIKGNQFPDTPEYMAKLGIVYMTHFLSGLEISPVARYIGPRYGNIQNKEKVDGYTTADINLAYKLNNISSSLKDLTLEVAVMNVTNAKYISSVSVSDESREGSASYYAGAPITVTWSVKGSF